MDKKWMNPLPCLPCRRVLALGESRLKQAALLDTEDALQKTLQVRDEAKAHVLPLCVSVLCSPFFGPLLGNCWEHVLSGKYRGNKSMFEPRGTFSPTISMVCTMHVAFKSEKTYAAIKKTYIF
jgi:hypothetical protein